MSVGKRAGERLKSTLASEAIARTKGLSTLLEDQGASDIAFSNPDPTEEYEIYRSIHASAALQLSTALGSERAIESAFAEAKLNPENPWHWRVLIELFAEACFPAKNKDVFWTSTRLMALLQKEINLSTKGNHGNL